MLTGLYPYKASTVWHGKQLWQLCSSVVTTGQYIALIHVRTFEVHHRWDTSPNILLTTLIRVYSYHKPSLLYFSMALRQYYKKGIPYNIQRATCAYMHSNIVSAPLIIHSTWHLTCTKMVLSHTIVLLVVT